MIYLFIKISILLGGNGARTCRWYAFPRLRYSIHWASLCVCTWTRCEISRFLEFADYHWNGRSSKWAQYLNVSTLKYIFTWIKFKYLCNSHIKIKVRSKNNVARHFYLRSKFFITNHLICTALVKCFWSY